MLTSFSQLLLDRRRTRGNRATELIVSGEDYDTAAKDIISDILTARFGPAGTLDSGLDSTAVEDATALINAALQAYFDDAEDYVEEPGYHRIVVEFTYRAE